MFLFVCLGLRAISSHPAWTKLRLGFLSRHGGHIHPRMRYRPPCERNQKEGPAAGAWRVDEIPAAGGEHLPHTGKPHLLHACLQHPRLYADRRHNAHIYHLVAAQEAEIFPYRGCRKLHTDLRILFKNNAGSASRRIPGTIAIV